MYILPLDTAGHGQPVICVKTIDYRALRADRRMDVTRFIGFQQIKTKNLRMFESLNIDVDRPKLGSEPVINSLFRKMDLGALFGIDLASDKANLTDLRKCFEKHEFSVRIDMKDTYIIILDILQLSSGNKLNWTTRRA